MLSEGFKLNTRQREIIEEVIKQNPMYKGNEHLLEKFCSEVYKKSYLLLDSVSNMDSLKNYLSRVVETSIHSVIKSNFEHNINDKSFTSINDIVGDVRREYENISIKNQPKSPAFKTKSAFLNKNNSVIVDLVNPYDGLIDPLEMVPEKSINPILAKRIVEAVRKIDANDPTKRFFDIFKMKYIQKLHQSVISRNLKLSQTDLSKKFCEMVLLVRKEIL